MKILNNVLFFIFLFFLYNLNVFQTFSQDSVSKNTIPKIVETKSLEADIAPENKQKSFPWWVWIILLFVVCFFIGIIAVLGGI